MGKVSLVDTAAAHTSLIESTCMTNNLERSDALRALLWNNFLISKHTNVQLLWNLRHALPKSIHWLTIPVVGHILSTHVYSMYYCDVQTAAVPDALLQDNGRFFSTDLTDGLKWFLHDSEERMTEQTDMLSFFVIVNQSVPKKLVYMGIVDVSCLCICADLAGIWQISGQVFCHSPIFSYITGNISMGLWAATCFCCVFLAFNRTWDLCLPTKAYIFEGKFMWFWLMLPTIYFIFFTFFERPLLYDPKTFTFLFDPQTNFSKYIDPSFGSSRLLVSNDKYCRRFEFSKAAAILLEEYSGFGRGAAATLAVVRIDRGRRVAGVGRRRRRCRRQQRPTVAAVVDNSDRPSPLSSTTATDRRRCRRQQRPTVAAVVDNSDRPSPLSSTTATDRRRCRRQQRPTVAAVVDNSDRPSPLSSTTATDRRRCRRQQRPTVAAVVDNSDRPSPLSSTTATDRRRCRRQQRPTVAAVVDNSDRPSPLSSTTATDRRRCRRQQRPTVAAVVDNSDRPSPLSSTTATDRRRCRRQQRPTVAAVVDNSDRPSPLSSTTATDRRRCRRQQRPTVAAVVDNSDRPSPLSSTTATDRRRCRRQQRPTVAAVVDNSDRPSPLSSTTATDRRRCRRQQRPTVAAVVDTSDQPSPLSSTRRRRSRSTTATATAATKYANVPHTVNNTVVIISLLSFYPLICGSLAFRVYRNRTSRISMMTKQIIIQSMVICGCHILGCFLYVYTQYFPVPSIFTVISNLAWIGNHGLPGIVYISLNKTIRSHVLVLIGLRRPHTKLHVLPTNTS
ncbi:hypothetical protein Y032_0358g3406 [Ancylostoma ceylanicum]|uniref:7TM GPCR serpentine receptor class x (Srx) domain-containing protein n=1 Tax=Ancylostoma ceylanicum TaxID=53326 RepID=A0A016RVU6_9BILA|nr:hypothetical protein Y032_0358g3406 [Ancylostoma ceylanicum]